MVVAPMELRHGEVGAGVIEETLWGLYLYGSWDGRDKWMRWEGLEWTQA